MLSWHYIWSQDYAFFHHLIQDTIKDDKIQLKPRFIEQAAFNKDLNKNDGHPLLGCLLKIDYFIDILKSASENVKEEPYIFFTDADIFVKPGIYNVLKEHMDRGDSMVFLKEGGANSANIGAILFKVCPEVIDFCEIVRARGLDDPNKSILLDQDFVNDVLREYNGTWSLFKNSELCCSNEYKGNKECVLVQILSSNIAKEFHVAEKLFFAAQLGVEMDKYMQYVPGHIIPYIYKFQDLLAKSRTAKSQN
jgi:hypothetical protein